MQSNFVIDYVYPQSEDTARISFGGVSICLLWLEGEENYRFEIRLQLDESGQPINEIARENYKNTDYAWISEAENMAIIQDGSYCTLLDPETLLKTSIIEVMNKLMSTLYYPVIHNNYKKIAEEMSWLE